MQKYALSVWQGPFTRDEATPPPTQTTRTSASAGIEVRRFSRQCTRPRGRRARSRSPGRSCGCARGTSGRIRSRTCRRARRTSRLPRACPRSGRCAFSDCSCCLTTTGVTPLSTNAGRKNVAPDSATIALRLSLWTCSPRSFTSGPESIARMPPATSSGPSSRRGSTLSEACPKTHVPAAMPARTVPMMPVYVLSETPTYGASMRAARISSMRTAAAARKTTTAPAAGRMAPTIQFAPVVTAA